MSRAGWMAALAVMLGGCSAAPTMYNWGSYEELIYASYAAPDSVSAQTQVETLEKDYQQARSANKPLPPGWHAQLGYLYFQLGKLDQAQQEFQTEKAQFPESALLMDRLLAGIKK
jgi:hypothetical protein